MFRFRQATLPRSHLSSIQLSAIASGFCSIGTSWAISSSPRGSIQRPKMGRKLKIPPTMSRNAAINRIANDEGLRNHWIASATFVGTRRLIIWKNLSSSALAQVPVRAFARSGFFGEALLTRHSCVLRQFAFADRPWGCALLRAGGNPPLRFNSGGQQRFS